MKHIRVIAAGFRGLANNNLGSVLPIATVGLVVLMALVGGGVDLARAYQVQNRLQYACDAGTLAGRRAVTNQGFTTTAQTQASRFFNANFDSAVEGTRNTQFVPSTPDNGNTIEATANTTMPTVVMNVFGFRQIPLGVRCSASMAVGNSDVVMVLDTTGSMACTAAMTESQCSTYISNNGYTEGTSSRLKDLRTAMKNFFSTVSTASAGTNARIRYGFVPYSSSVNVGRLLPASYLVDSMVLQTRRPVYRSEQQFDHYGPPVTTYPANYYSATTNGNWTNYTSTTYTSLNSCNNAKPANIAWANSGGSSSATTIDYDANSNKIETTRTTQGQTQTSYQCVQSGNNYRRQSRTDTRSYYTSIVTKTYPAIYVAVQVFDGWQYYQDDAVDVSRYKTFAATARPNGSNGANVNYTWNGCIEERNSVNAASFSYSSITGMNPSGAYDLNIDLAPDSNATRWRPMFADVMYTRKQWVAGNRGGGSWVTTTEVASDGDKAGSYCPYRSQLLATMTQTDFNTYVNNLTPSGATYHDIGMIWGGRLASSDGIFSSNVTEAPANGGSVARHVVFMTDGQLAPNNDIYSSYGIELYNKRVTSDGSTGLNSRHASRFLAICEAIKAKGIRIWVIAFSTGLSSDMSTCASDGSAYTAANATQLNNAFQEIARQVGELRITQ